MSTITSPRDSSVNGRRIPQISTPTSSSRPSLEVTRSSDPSPSRSTSTTAPPQRRNRAALREYYNLKKQEAPSIDDNASEVSSLNDYDTSSTALSELDDPSFNAQSYISRVLETQSLGELLKTYNAVLTDIRALDAEKKALVYDNYSKLIAATETIGRMRGSMESGNPMAKTLDLAIVGIYERAEGIKGELRRGMPESQRRELEMGKDEREAAERKRRIRKVIQGVLDAPAKVRELVADGKMEDARWLWKDKLRLLERWRERGVGGDDVEKCIDEGEAALRGEAPVIK
ncbi:Vacuolar sorting-associated 51 [Hyphodiscus hymeniophilus]|uniref:Vacuolar protein sorting-associated protein 51 homolog n=1 Tax=Hyphodiscus hymeniophilus TaxID=353542 RepID=A0A9P6VFR7_9HELO|nr:Vacuolar sorting-associated 51 [Hyphodiscus hymeniophilus]